MLVQDTLTGTLHEVPDGQLYETDFAEYPEQLGEGQVVYDGLGNPVGFLPFIPKIASLATSLIPGLFGRRPSPPGLPPLPPQIGPAVQAAVSYLPRPPFPPPFRPPWPAGWVRPPLPYTGLGPRRLYMRCAVWPGPRGLVPATAAQTPAAAAAAAAQQQAAAVAQMGRRRRRRR